MATLLLGRPIADTMLVDIRKKSAGKKLQLCVVQIGENNISEKYIAEKQKACEQVGIQFQLSKFPKTISRQSVEKELIRFANNPNVSGMIVQLPLPSHLNAQKLLDLIPFEKDVDVLSSRAFGSFALGMHPILPPTVGAVSRLLAQVHANLKGKKVALVGAGRLVGLPLMLWMLRQKADIAVATSTTKNLAQVTKQADVIISGVGKPNLILGSMVKKGAIVIDAGTSVEAGQSAGDVDIKSVSKKAAHIAPVPGGVGPLTVACLLENLVVLSEDRRNL